jgi:hypothetical protein
MGNSKKRATRNHLGNTFIAALPMFDWILFYEVA